MLGNRQGNRQGNRKKDGEYVEKKQIPGVWESA